jgi:predicted DNA-binding protein (MmcQ/YjbR family)
MAKRVAKKSTQSKTPKARSKATRSASLTDFCRSLTGTTEDVKWGNDLMFSVGKKMYAGFDADDAAERRLGFKCDDIDFERLTKMKGVKPAPYAARFGWVSVDRVEALPGLGDDKLMALLRKSHGLVASCLPTKLKRELGLEGPAATAKRRTRRGTGKN